MSKEIDKLKYEIEQLEAKLEKKVDSELMSFKNRKGSWWKLALGAVVIVAVGVVIGVAI